MRAAGALGEGRDQRVGERYLFRLEDASASTTSVLRSIRNGSARRTDLSRRRSRPKKIDRFAPAHRPIPRANDADEPRGVDRNGPFQKSCGAAGLILVVRDDITDEHICIDANHFRLGGSGSPAAASAIAVSMSSIETGPTLLFRSPSSAAIGTTGRLTTLPSGWMKNFTYAGLSPRWSRMGLGMVAWPLAVSADCMRGSITFVHRQYLCARASNARLVNRPAAAIQGRVSAAIQGGAER